MIRDILHELKVQGYAPQALLDVGAHVGTFTRLFLDVFPDCVPTLIEPNPYCQDELSRLRFERHAAAASDKSGRAPLFLSKEWLQSTGCSLYQENTAHFRAEVVATCDVETRRIDDLFAGRRFDFVKIDTQGSELDVLRGGVSVLGQADYILVEVSLVEYNIGAAPAEAVFAQLRAMGFRCADVTEFHRLANVHDGNLLQMDFLFERRPARKVAIEPDRTSRVRTLAQSLFAEGRSKDALNLLEFLDHLDPGNAQTLRPLVKTLGVEGRTLEAMQKLVALKAASPDMNALVVAVEEQLPAALERFNRHAAAGEIAEAETYASALVALIPRNKALLEAAFSCNRALGRTAYAAHYAAMLELLAKAGAALPENGHGPGPAPAAETETHPLIRLRDIHDQMSAILCDELTPHSAETIACLLCSARDLTVPVPAGSEWAAWEKHYRLMLDSIDLEFVQGATPAMPPGADVTFATSAGAAVNWLELRAAAARLGAEAVFFAAADETYIDLYARWYIKTILKNCDVPCLVLVHAIGGADRLPEVANSVGIRDKRLYFAGDRFDAAAVGTECFDAPPKGRSQKPLAHLQSIRFLRLGTLLETLKRPVFVSDIDLVLQDRVKDLLDRTAGADIVLNRNAASPYAGSQLTANLLLVNPTQNAALFLGFLGAYLERQLEKPAVSRWIDQLALLLARHHLSLRGSSPQIAYFDTNRDINNVMYPAYQDNPFRFLSLFHGFDMSSLEKANSSGPVRQRAGGKRRAQRTRP